MNIQETQISSFKYALQVESRAGKSGDLSAEIDKADL